MAKKKELVWTEEQLRYTLESLGAKAPKTKDTTKLHGALTELLKERDPKDSVDERLANLHSIAVKKVAHKDAPSTTDAPESECVTFGKGYDAKADQCKNCEDGAEVVALCKDRTAEYKKAQAPKKKVKLPSKNTKKRYDSLEAMREHLKVAPTDNITMRLDRYIALYQYTLDTMMKKLEEDRAELSTPEKPVRDFSTKSRIKGHIAYRTKNNLWDIRWEGKNSDIPNVVGFLSEEVVEEKKAAVG